MYKDKFFELINNLNKQKMEVKNIKGFTLYLNVKDGQIVNVRQYHPNFTNDEVNTIIQKCLEHKYITLKDDDFVVTDITITDEHVDYVDFIHQGYSKWDEENGEDITPTHLIDYEGGEKFDTCIGQPEKFYSLF